MTISEPDSDSGEFDEVSEQLVIAGCNASELIDLVEETLAAVALLI